MPRGTVSAILSREKERREYAALMKPTPNPGVAMIGGRAVADPIEPLPWASARQRLVDKFSAAAELAVATLDANLRVGNDAGAANCAKIAGLCVDKASLLSGQATEIRGNLSVSLSTSLAELAGLAKQDKPGRTSLPELIDTTSEQHVLPPVTKPVTNDDDVTDA